MYGQEALLPIDLELATLRVIAKNDLGQKGKVKDRILQLELLQNDRELVVEYYKAKAEKRRNKFNKQLAPKSLQEGQLVLRYDNMYDNKKDGKFQLRWEGPFQIIHKFDNGSYQLQDMSGKFHNTRVNGWRLKPYFSRIQEEDITYQDGADPQGIG